MPAPAASTAKKKWGARPAVVGSEMEYPVVGAIVMVVVVLVIVALMDGNKDRPRPPGAGGDDGYGTG